MTRREVIKQTALLTGYALTASMIQGIMSGCQSTTSHAEWKPSYFTQEQADLISAAAERILPRTNTPGALDAGVPEYIEIMVKNTFQPREREAFQLGLKSFNPNAIAQFGKPFLELTTEEQEKVLVKMESEEILNEIERRERNFSDPMANIERQIEKRANSRNQEMETPPMVVDWEAFERNRLNSDYPFYLRFKQLVLAGYFSSKLVGTEVTNYDPNPGVYKGCIPLSDVPNQRIYSL
ncbi:MAG: gluconate 2-dehydrogenase subunit 3 family protein [Saprospiraceae bacterium]